MAAEAIDLDEAATRAIIDEQLRDRGWEADSAQLCATLRARGRPRDGTWPSPNGRPPAVRPTMRCSSARRCVGVVEAKRQRKNVSAAIDQAERYSKGFRFQTGECRRRRRPMGRASSVPFLFSANGRPYLKQIETESGIWFRDARSATNHRRALVRLVYAGRPARPSWRSTATPPTQP